MWGYKPISSFYIRVSRLRRSNRQFSEMSCGLTDANRTNEQYAGNYMDLCPSYIGKLDEYRHQPNRTVAAGGLGAVKRERLSPDIAERECRNFYGMFDATILDMFPDFVGRSMRCCPNLRDSGRGLRVLSTPNFVYRPSSVLELPTA